jgi:hypothetical protein
MKKLFLVSLLLLVATGCCSFNRDWKNALAAPRTDTDISGAWEGRWLSDKNGHTGKLRGILTEAGPDEYNARFRATFWKIFRATYEVPLKYERKNGEFLLRGEADLGLLSGGVYRYEGKATPESFFSTYRCKYDHGTFEMKRAEMTKSQIPRNDLLIVEVEVVRPWHAGR